eukprot:g13568.t1
MEISCTTGELHDAQMTGMLQNLVLKHDSVRQARNVGLFGCLDLQNPNGHFIQRLGGASPPEVQLLRQAMRDQGLMALFRPPLLHCAPPLVIQEEQLREGFQMLTKALEVLDLEQQRLYSLGSPQLPAAFKRRRSAAFTEVFGFKIRVENPQGFDPAQKDGWNLFTTDASDYIVDGTPQTIPFTKMDDTSWGIYSSSNLEVLVRISDLRPFLMTERRAWVSVVISNHPAAETGFIRFRAPEGYVWNFDNTEFVYQTVANTPIALRELVPPGVTADFPSGVPMPRDGSNTLIFQPSTFAEFAVYGFAAPVEVPTMSPTASTNAFFFELGFNATDTNTRPAAAFVEAPRVRALKNAKVDYATTIIGKENLVQFRLETVTDIPPGGDPPTEIDGVRRNRS